MSIHVKSRRIRLFACLGCLALALQSSAQIASDCEMETRSPCQSSAASGFSESPQGLIDGRNTSFHIHLTPSNDAPVTLFRNGLALLRGVDYQVTGQVLTISPSHAPVSGDVLRIVYTPRPGTRAKAEGIAQSTTPTPVTINGANEMSNAAAWVALRSEEAQMKGSSRAFLRPSTEAYPTASLETPLGPESLRMLSEQLRGTRTAPTSKPRRTSRKGISLQGVDGLGDGLGLHADLLDDVDEPAKTVSKRDADPLSFDPPLDRRLSTEQDLSGSSSAALRLLQQRLDLETGAQRETEASGLTLDQPKKAKSRRIRPTQPEN
jgi:hypothetical protein